MKASEKTRRGDGFRRIQSLPSRIPGGLVFIGVESKKGKCEIPIPATSRLT
jgi:hypothetical protein